MWGCSESVLSFGALPCLHTFLKDNSNDVYPLSVIRSCAAGYVKVGFEKNSGPAKSIKKIDYFRKLNSCRRSVLKTMTTCHNGWATNALPTWWFLCRKCILTQQLPCFYLKMYNWKLRRGRMIWWCFLPMTVTFMPIIMPPRRLSESRKGWYHTRYSKTSHRKSL